MATPVLSVAQLQHNHDSILQGQFSVPQCDELFTRSSLHDALVMSITYNSGHVVTRPYMNFAMFEDDLSRTDELITGTFNINISAYLRKLGSNHYHVMFSLGRHLSNIFEIAV